MKREEKHSSEKRLIDADALAKAIRTDYFEHFTRYHDTDQIALIDMVCDDIEESPTVDAVEVVRCWECKYLMFSDCYGECSKGHMGVVRPDDFCSRGERKEGAD